MIERIYRVVRGGSWVSLPYYLRASYRGGIDPDYRNYNLGFRLVVRIEEKEE